MGPDMLALVGGNVGRLVDAIGLSFLAPYVDVDHVSHWFGGIKKFHDVNRLVRTLKLGATVDVEDEVTGLAVLEYGNHDSTIPHAHKLRSKVITDVTNGKAIVLDIVPIRFGSCAYPQQEWRKKFFASYFTFFFPITIRTVP